MSNGKHIAVICNYELKPNRIGGMDRFFVAYDRACKAKGFQVDWFFSNSTPHRFYINLTVYASEELSAEDQYLSRIASEKYDIVVTHFLALCTSFYKRLKEKNQPYIIAVDHNPRPLKGFPLKKRIKNRLKGIIYSRYINQFVGVSKYTKDCISNDYGQFLKKKTTIIYNGIDASIYLKRTEENPGKFIVASHLRESKGIQDLIEAVNLFSEEKKQLLKIDIFGVGPLETRLKEMVREYKLEPQFSFRGSTSNLPDLLQNYSFLLQPTYMECFSLSILESLAANLPVITTPVGGNPEIIAEGKNGFIFKTGDIKALSSILEKVLQEKLTISEDVSTLIKNQFPLEKMVKEHINLLPCT
ncbi:glycosyltransferase family 4 protein [Autumnicola psychrophila]|uniref:Glycosyltransferase family 4 protein n=1 Tax=Autumnicola psychrophila TaxID=3075592 RepID=A0ABU3DSZ0_9FLAO|nr:glycosyltransferase family 4 protein [Zunongwangia sp. F225]MDT0686840.1 glycosyltransferase family 4 protein [Zunongwangia sp. F225]